MRADKKDSTKENSLVEYGVARLVEMKGLYEVELLAEW